jgi:hypothetical protein
MKDGYPETEDPMTHTDRPDLAARDRLAMALHTSGYGQRWADEPSRTECEDAADAILAALPPTPEPAASPPFVVRQFEGKPWVPLHEAARLHDAHQEAVLTIAGLRNALAIRATPEPVAPLREALLHLAQRRHDHSNGCDGCLNVQKQVRAALAKTPGEPG